jgi:hypothetical protein
MTNAKPVEEKTCRRITVPRGAWLEGDLEEAMAEGDVPAPTSA